jgi:hypothetical protein
MAKTLTSINVDGEYQQVWEIYTDETQEQTFGFIFDEEDARLIENLLKDNKNLDKTFQQA